MSNSIFAKGYSGSAAPVGHAASTPADIYFSADVESDGPIPGPYSMLSFALVPAGRMDGSRYTAPSSYEDRFYVELKPISDQFEAAALAAPEFLRFADGKPAKKVIVVPGRLVNVVV